MDAVISGATPARGLIRASAVTQRPFPRVAAVMLVVGASAGLWWLIWRTVTVLL